MLVSSVIRMYERDRYSNGTSQRAVFYRVLQQVAKYLMKTDFVAFEQVWAVGCVNTAANLVLGKRCTVIGNSFLHNIFQVECFQIQCNLTTIDPCYF